MSYFISITDSYTIITYYLITRYSSHFHCTMTVNLSTSTAEINLHSTYTKVEVIERSHELRYPTYYKTYYSKLIDYFSTTIRDVGSQPRREFT